MLFSSTGPIVDKQNENAKVSSLNLAERFYTPATKRITIEKNIQSNHVPGGTFYA